TRARTTPISCRTSVTSSPAGGGGASSSSVAAVTITCPPASAVSRITGSSPRAARTSLSASAVVAAVKRLIFIEGHHADGLHAHVGGDLVRRHDCEGWEVALDEPPQMRAERRRAQQD